MDFEALLPFEKLYQRPSVKNSRNFRPYFVFYMFNPMVAEQFRRPDISTSLWPVQTWPQSVQEEWYTVLMLWETEMTLGFQRIGRWEINLTLCRLKNFLRKISLLIYPNVATQSFSCTYVYNVTSTVWCEGNIRIQTQLLRSLVTRSKIDS